MNKQHFEQATIVALEIALMRSERLQESIRTLIKHKRELSRSRSSTSVAIADMDVELTSLHCVAQWDALFFSINALPFSEQTISAITTHKHSG